MRLWSRFKNPLIIDSNSSEMAATSSVSSLSSAGSTIDSKQRQSLTTHKLTYSIHKYSSSSSTYLPENILEDKPKDQSSRWSSEANTPPQYLILKLEKPAIVTKITFGKYEKTHVCNLKRFKVFGIAAAASRSGDDSLAEEREDFELCSSSGINSTNTIMLIDSGLKNDPIPETFRLKNQVNGQYLPCKYIKIMPIQSWGPSFNFSIWYVALEGDDSPEIVRSALRWHDQFKETEAIRMCLKHFRQQNYLSVFDMLQKKTKIQLEDPVLSELHDALVQAGDHETTERLITNAIDGGLFDDWMNGQQPIPRWTALILPDEYLSEDLSQDSPVVEDPNAASLNNNEGDPNPPSPAAYDFDQHRQQQSEDNSADSTPSSSSNNAISLPVQPGCRGGHQLVIDSTNQTLYLFGGWDGNRDLADLWAYHIPSAKWTLLSLDTEADGGPSPRSCHKMVLDTSHRHIFILGRYLERGLRDRAQNMKSDFYMYDIETRKWTLITDDTHAMGGPLLIFDHQMCIDQDTRTIYVFGGQSLQSCMSEGTMASTGEKTYSGLFEYHIPTNTWRKRCDDVGIGVGVSSATIAGGDEDNPETVRELKSRSSHSMLFHPRLKKLFIFGGQRKGNEYLNDFFSFNVDTGDVEVISTGTCPESAIPAVGHTQRSTIDVEKSEVHVMTGLNKDKSDRKGDAKVSNSFWVYSIPHNKWTCVYKNENNSSKYWNRMQGREPRPRYAHQLVYDDVNQVHFMFGGNPGGKQGKENRLRLGDFWQLKLQRPDRAEVLRKSKILIRQCKFSELVQSDPMTALSYLHNSLAQVVDHSNEKEEREFQLLTSELFKTPGGGSSMASTSSTTSEADGDKTHQLRSELFDKLAGQFPEAMTQPRGNLIDLIPF